MAKIAKTTAVGKASTAGEITIPTSTKEVGAVIEQLKAQLKVLKGDVDETVSLDIKYNGKTIKDITSVTELLQISSSIHAQEKAYTNELCRYNLQKLKIAPLSFSEKPVDYWTKVIEKAINNILNTAQIAKLEKAISDLSEHVSKEQKIKDTLAKIMEESQAYIK